jgi:nicotinamidase/pyrazinamidase
MASTRGPVQDQDVLLVVDIQNDFCPGGALPVSRGNEVVPVINRLADGFRHVVLTQDWHPANHVSFASRYPARKVFETMELSYGLQTLWPDHCVQDTHGAEFVGDLHAPHAELVLRKGVNPEMDSYSAFFENDHKTHTGLGGYLRERGFERVFIAGLALDFCVRYSAEDACRYGFSVSIIQDACRAIDTGGSLAEAQQNFTILGIPLMASSDLA